MKSYVVHFRIFFFESNINPVNLYNFIILVKALFLTLFRGKKKNAPREKWLSSRPLV